MIHRIPKRSDFRCKTLSRAPLTTEAFKNLEPIRESLPTAKATSSMLAPVASQMAERALMEEIRWANMALAASLESSEDQRPTVKILSWGTQLA